MRGFFARNRAELPRDPNFNIKSEKAKVVGNLTIEEVRDIIQNSNVTYKAVSLVIFQGGMDTNSFEYWNTQGYKDLIKQLRQGPDIIKIALPGRKRQRNKTPYIHLLAVTQ